MKMTALRLLLIVAVSVTVSLSGVPASQSPAAEKKARRQQTRQFLKEARHAIDSADYSRATTALDSVLALDAKNADGYYMRGLVAIYAGDTARAVDALSLGVERCTLSSRLKLFLTRLKIAAGQYDEARQLVDAVLAIKPRSGEALFLKGMILIPQGDTAAAIDLFEKALEYNREKSQK